MSSILQSAISVCYLLPYCTLALGQECRLPKDALVPDRIFIPPMLVRAEVAPMPREAKNDDITLPPDELVPESVALALAGEQRDWGHGAIGFPNTYTGKGVKVAVLDTGCDPNHKDLKTAILKGKNFTTSQAGWADVQGHGTHCAGIIAARANDWGAVGAAPECQLLIVKVLGDNGSGSDSWIAAGIDWAVEEGADVISMSLGSKQPSPAINAAIKRGLDKSRIFCIAAGNSGPGANTVDWPGAYGGVVCTAAIDKSLKVAGFSSRGPQLIVCAPGVQIISCYPGDRLASLSGTSMATPYIAAVAACWVEYCKAKGLKHDCPSFIAALTAAVKDLGPTGRDTAYGFGLAQIARMVAGDPPSPMPGEVTIGRDDLTESGKAKFDQIGVDVIKFIPKKKD